MNVSECTISKQENCICQPFFIVAARSSQPLADCTLNLFTISGVFLQIDIYNRLWVRVPRTPVNKEKIRPDSGPKKYPAGFHPHPYISNMTSISGDQTPIRSKFHSVFKPNFLTWRPKTSVNAQCKCQACTKIHTCK